VCVCGVASLRLNDIGLDLAADGSGQYYFCKDRLWAFINSLELRMGKLHTMLKEHNHSDLKVEATF